MTGDLSRDEDLNEPGVAGSSLMTSVGVAGGQVLLYIERHGPVSLLRLMQALDSPSDVVTMGVGALIREGMLRGSQRELSLAKERRAYRGLPAGLCDYSG